MLFQLKDNCSVPPSERLTTFEARCRPWYTKSRANVGNTITHDPYLDSVLGTVIITFTRAFNTISGLLKRNLTVVTAIDLDLSIHNYQRLTENLLPYLDHYFIL
jgi:hypothetical protein